MSPVIACWNDFFSLLLVMRMLHVAADFFFSCFGHVHAAGMLGIIFSPFGHAHEPPTEEISQQRDALSIARGTFVFSIAYTEQNN